MQKVVKLLEKNVEWIAVALGGAFLLWMIYSYAFLKPVTTSIGGTLTAPGEVDTKTDEGPAKLLQAAVANQHTPTIPKKEFAADLKNQLGSAGDAVAMATPWINEPLPPQQLKTSTAVGPAAPVVNAQMVGALPEPLPPPDSLQFSQGRSNAMIPAPPQAGVQPGPAAAGGPGTPADKNWVTVAAIIHIQPILQAFQKANIPPAFISPAGGLVLRVELVREEQKDDGSWGPDTVIPALQNVNIPPMPPKNAPQGAIQPASDYVDFASKDQKDLLQPDFYQVLQADPWTMPGVPPPVVPEAPFDPSTVTDTSGLTPDQLKQYQDYQAKKEEQEREDRAKQYQQQHQQQTPQRPPGGYGPPGGGGGYGPGGGGPRGAAMDNQRPLTLAQAVVPPSAQPPIPAGMPPVPPGTPDANAAANNINPAMNNPQASLPTGAFDPTKQPDIVVWAHDDTAQPGKAYRYKLRYYMENPVWRTVNVCKPPQLADQFYIQSKDSAWTDQVNVKSDTNFFAISVSGTSQHPSVKFDIFRWQNGAWQMQTTEASPGDSVGIVDPTSKVDFNTKLTLVGVIEDPSRDGNNIILLTTDGGMISRHNLADDQRSPDHAKLKKAAADALAPKTAAAAGPS